MIRRFFFVIILICLFFITLEAEYNRSKIESDIKKAKGNERVDLLIEFAEHLLQEDLSLCSVKAEEALILARKKKYRYGEWQALNIQGRIELLRGNYWEAIDKFEETLKLLDKPSTELQRGIVNSNIASSYNKLGWPDRAQDKLHESISIYKRLEQTPKVIEELARNYLNIGTIDLERGKFEEALQSLLNAMQEVEKIDNPSLEATIKGYIGTVYQSLLNPALALEYYNQALQVHESVNNKEGIANVYGNKGNLYSDLGDFSKALEYYEKSLTVFEELQDSLSIASALANIGNVYYAQGDYDTTLSYYHQILDIFDKMGAEIHLAYLKNNMGMLYLMQEDYEKAEESIREALHYAKKNDSLELQAQINASLSELYLAQDDAEQALHYKEVEASLRDSIFAETTAQQIAEMQTKYDTERTERENRLKDLEIERKEMQRNYLIALAAAVMILVFVIYRRYRSKKKSAEILKTKNDLITRQKEELSQTLDELQKTQKKLVESEKMASLGSLVTGVAHEINTPVGIIVTAASNLTDRQKDLMRKLKDNRLKKSELDAFLSYTEKAGKLILSNSQRTGELVKSFKKVSIDQSTEEKRQFKIGNYIKDVITSLEPKFKGKIIERIIECDEYLVWNSYPGILAQIITNLVINSLVHGFAGRSEGKIGFLVKTEDSRLIMEYFDNGRGMKEEVLKKIFDPFFTTNKQTGSGLGMHIIYNLVTQKLNGNISVESKPGSGARFKMDFPFSGGGLSEL